MLIYDLLIYELKRIDLLVKFILSLFLYIGEKKEKDGARNSAKKNTLCLLPIINRCKYLHVHAELYIVSTISNLYLTKYELLIDL